MIHQIDTTDPAQGRQATAVSPATPAGRNFASVLASQRATAQAHAKEAIEAPEGEVWRPVRGDDNYAKIVEGPRAGMYINLSRGARRGEVFTVENRDGVRVHVYQGKNGKETVVPAAKDSGKVRDGDVESASGARRPKSEEWAPVDGANNYADILSGPRNGWYVNTSGGVRDGMAFQIVQRGGKTFHAYGTGKHKQLIEVDTGEPKKSGSTTGAAAPGRSGSVASSESTTGGAAAPGDDD